MHVCHAHICLNGFILHECVLSHADDISASESESHRVNFSSIVPDTEVKCGKLPTDLPEHINKKWFIKTANDIVCCLRQYGIAVVNNFLGEKLGEKILNEVITCYML